MDKRSRSMSRALGVIVAASGGLIGVPLADWAVHSLIDQALLVLLLALLAAVSAWLLRTWWAVLAVPAIVFAGYMAGGVVQAGVRGTLYSSNFSLLSHLFVVTQVFAIFYLVPLVVAAALGTVVALRTTSTQK
jgi:hypothetical protein